MAIRAVKAEAERDAALAELAKLRALHQGAYDFCAIDDVEGKLEAARVEVDALWLELVNWRARCKVLEDIRPVELLAERDKFRDDWFEVTVERDRLRAALEWIANNDNWLPTEPARVLARARQALAADSRPADGVARCTCPFGHSYPAPADARKPPGPCPVCRAADGRDEGEKP